MHQFYHVTAGKHALRCRFQAGPEPFDKLRLPGIVVGGPHEIGRACLVEDKPEVFHHRNERRLPENPDARVSLGKPAAYFGRAVVGGIVRDDNLNIRQGLRNQGLKRLFEMSSAIADRNANSHFRGGDLGHGMVLERQRIRRSGHLSGS
ncbi:MAG: hypothetical protein WCZ23_10280 [Rhodospirillaceae bacterium]